MYSYDHPLGQSARTPPPTLLFLSSLVKEQHPKMQFPKTTAPHSGFTRLEPPACQGNIGAASSWQRRDEPDLGSFSRLVNPVFRETREPGRPSSEDETSAERTACPDLRQANQPAF